MNFGYGYGAYPMMSGGFGLFTVLGLLTWIILIVVGIFLAIYLWQKINKK